MINRHRHTAILVNRAANAGKAEKSWSRIQNQVLNLLPDDPFIIAYHPSENIDDIIRELIHESGVRSIISAGGDGSLHYVINCLMDYPKSIRREIIVGCIGLGSSNDSLKPFKETIAGIPVRIDAHQAIPIDLGLVYFDDDKSTQRYFINNASLGVTARANNLFNNPDTFIRLTKKRLTDVAIIFSALKTIMTNKNIPMSIIYSSGHIDSDISSISIIKTPYLGGILKYDQHIDRNDGQLGINICDRMSRIRLVKTVYNLTQAKFTDKPGCISFHSPYVHIECPDRVSIEMDGEITFGHKFRVEVSLAAINFINA